MKVYGQLEAAQLELLSSDPTGTEGRVIYNSTAKVLKYHNGTSWLQKSQDVALGAVGATPNANGASISASQVLNLQPADGSNPGALTAIAQTIGGAKTFAGNMILQSLLQVSQASDTTAGTAVQLATPASVHVRLTSGSLVSVAMIPAPSQPSLLALTNATGVVIQIADETGATAANRIRTGTAGAINIKNNASILLVYDLVDARWKIIGGTGSGGALAVGTTQNIAGGAAVTIITTENRQLIPVAGSGGAQVASLTPFGTTAPQEGYEIFLIGTDNTNTLELTYNDAAKGVVGPFSSIILGRFEIARFIYVSALDRYIGGKV